MRQMASGTGVNTTATVQAALIAGNQIYQADLYLFSTPDDPLALWLTNWESPLLWSWWGTFQNAVITRGTVASAIGLDSKSLDISWSPANTNATANIGTTSPYQLAQVGYYDNMNVLVWRCLMPTPGDANTWGAYPLFGGVIGQTTVERGSIKFSVNDYMYVLNEKVPTAVIEVTNTLASYTAATPPAGFSFVPELTVTTVDNNEVFNADVITGLPGHIFGNNVLAGGYLVFEPGSTLAGQYSIIAANSEYTDGGGNHHNHIQVYSGFNWEPSPGDTFYVSAASPIDQADGDYYGFPYVPTSPSAV